MAFSATDFDLSASTRFSDEVDRRPSAAKLRVPTLTILAHRDRRRIGEIARLPELFSGGDASLSRREPSFSPIDADLERPLADSHLSRKPIRLTARGEQQILLDPSKSSTPVLVDGDPLEESRIFQRADLERGVTLELGRYVALLLHLRLPLTISAPHFGLVGDSDEIIELRREIQTAAKQDGSILLRGASGTGKELVAQAIHEASSRREGPWITVNMAAVSPQLAAAELFGTKKGAFTGAVQDRPGFFAAAHGGTLFLDEIGDAPDELQPLLLRALESGEIQPVGDQKTRKVDVRVIAATDADLEKSIAEERFRGPLLHRLAGWDVRLPLLAERRDDVARLLAFFLRRESSGDGSLPSAAIFARLTRYDWPGNVRQLANIAHRIAVLLAADREDEISDALDRLTPEASRTSSESIAVEADESIPAPSPRTFRNARDVEREEVEVALREARWDLKPAAEALSISRTVLYKLLEKYDIRTAKDLAAEEIRRALDECGDDLADAADQLQVSYLGLRIRLKALGLSAS